MVMDAGVATGENLGLIREEGLHYVSVRMILRTRSRKETLRSLRKIESSKVSAKKLEGEGEILLDCESSGRARKEEAMKTLFQKRFEGGLQTEESRV